MFIWNINNNNWKEVSWRSFHQPSNLTLVRFKSVLIWLGGLKLTCESEKNTTYAVGEQIRAGCQIARQGDLSEVSS